MNMENKSVEEIIKERAKSRITKSQGIAFLQEYRANPEKFLPLADHQYKYFDKWEEETIRNLCWDAGIYQDNCPYFAECWKIFTTTLMTVYISVKGISWEPSLKNILVEFIRNGLISGLPSAERPQIDVNPFSDGHGNEFLCFTMVLGNDEKGRLICWGRGSTKYGTLNEYNQAQHGEQQR